MYKSFDYEKCAQKKKNFFFFNVNNGLKSKIDILFLQSLVKTCRFLTQRAKLIRIIFTIMIAKCRLIFVPLKIAKIRFFGNTKFMDFDLKKTIASKEFTIFRILRWAARSLDYFNQNKKPWQGIYGIVCRCQCKK